MNHNIDNLLMIIGEKQSLINHLQKEVNRLELYKTVTFDQYKQNMINEINDYRKFKDNLLIQLQNDFKRYEIINYILKEYKYECPICYEQLNLQNMYVPECHFKHIICINCSKMLNKCPLCKKQYYQPLNYDAT